MARLHIMTHTTQLLVSLEIPHMLVVELFTEDSCIPHRPWSCKKHLHIMGLFGGDPICRFCRIQTETVFHIICCCEALACLRYNFFGKLFAEPKDICMASLKDLSLFIRETGLAL
jgi:hypothetical protein